MAEIDQPDLTFFGRFDQDRAGVRAPYLADRNPADRSQRVAGQTALAKQLLASPDLDLILGCHEHVVQPIAKVDGKWVVYGMGLTGSSAQAVVQLFAAPSRVLGTTSIFSLLLVAVFG